MRLFILLFVLVAAGCGGNNSSSGAESISTDEQNMNPTDSTIIVKIVTDFYGWYLTSIKEKHYTEFQPQFIENDKGMTTLYFSKYIKSLKTYRFSDSLIDAEIESYQECISHLEKTKYSVFTSTWIDLDDFESTNCDFGNYYRWIGGQEPVDGVTITQLQINDKQSALVTLEGFDEDLNGEKNYSGSKKVKLKKQTSEWKITFIE